MTFLSPAAMLALCLSFPSAFAQDKPAEPPAQQLDAMQVEFDAAVAQAKAASRAGPAEIPLLDQAVLKLPQGYVYFPAKETGRLLRAMGNRVTEDPLGMVVAGEGSDGQWFVVMQFDASGYVKDDDAKEWDAEELLKSIREGTDATNEERRAKGLPESEIVGWIEAPAYDAATHRLVWSLASRLKGDDSQTERTVNYNTYALGREGYVSLNLVTGTSSIDQEKRHARTLLAALEYNDGKRYTDFNADTDKVAAYGLAALVGGVAAKKLGLLAVIAAFAAKFAKVIGVAAIGLGAVALKYFRNRKGKGNEGNPPA